MSSHRKDPGDHLPALLGHGETPDSQNYGDAIVKVAMYLIETAKESSKKMITVGGQGLMHATSTASRR
ncbi:MAG: hypothetical protein KA250_00080 [Verrucomicrobiales bacterium]|nr:hypothetical protein [Verrucomicrobiales bacterium]MBP9223602.1 hypothetical protein [Verrucomicrobiales bacterium]HQZ26508.1 hypothetical protein [Verrucomicrobiales bacterium]